MTTSDPFLHSCGLPQLQHPAGVATHFQLGAAALNAAEALSVSENDHKITTNYVLMSVFYTQKQQSIASKINQLID